MRRFEDRRHAGRLLGSLLSHLAGTRPVVLGIPRGGVVVAAEIADALGGSLGALVAVKVRAPFNQELAIGAVAPGAEPTLDRGLLDRLGLSPADCDRAVEVAVAEASRRQSVFGAVPPLEGATIVVADDGVATGATLEAALGRARGGRPDRLVCAIPVGPPDTVARLAALVDEMVCPLQPARFGAVGEFFEDFGQVPDDEVLSLLGRPPA
ncbi:MAG: phosphoribosyltransferase family protein [Acidimicrobiia bacterium]|nr:MAG: phosphoribosyltransferase family protein [Acidimicrobiia bacterium]